MRNFPTFNGVFCAQNGIICRQNSTISTQFGRIFTFRGNNRIVLQSDRFGFIMEEVSKNRQYIV